jgi:hypothetical protein
MRINLPGQYKRIGLAALVLAATVMNHAARAQQPKPSPAQQTRTEKDLLGEKQIPSSASNFSSEMFLSRDLTRSTQ